MPTTPAWLQPRAALRAAAKLPLPREYVAECLTESDELFRRAWREGLDALTPAERRGRLCADIGAVAEAVATLLLRDAGLDVFAQIVELGIRGVDLLALTPEPSVLALEVKGTLRANRLPRLSRGKERQMSIAWLNDPANLAMAEWGLEAMDIYGGVAVLDFGRNTWRAALTADHTLFTPVTDAGQLGALDDLAP